ncbi:MAG: homoserine kinase [Lutimonas sp.]
MSSKNSNSIQSLELFCPGTIANISCGFDVLGCCLDSVGDRMWIRKTTEPGLRISRIAGADLPMDPAKNVVGPAIQALLSAMATEPNFGFELEIEKNIKPGSGIGSSAASAAGAVFGVNKLLGEPFTAAELVPFAAEGERLACGSPIADNVTPALLGGFSLVQSEEPLRVFRLPVISGLCATVIHPQIEIKTSDSRAILPEKVALKDAIRQWANVGTLVHALHQNDPELFGLALHDHIVEPHRSKLIPLFDEVRDAALEKGALGCGISGSGPSIFAFSKNMEIAENVKTVFKEIYSKTSIPFQVYTSRINEEGIKILNQEL